MKSGAYDKEKVTVTLPSGKGKYNWEAIKKAIEAGQVYVLPEDAKRNSMLTGIRREKIDARVGTVEGTEQLVLVPK